MADLLRRWLEVSGFAVTHVKNITDVGHLLHDSDHGDDDQLVEGQPEGHPARILADAWGRPRVQLWPTRN